MINMHNPNLPTWVLYEITSSCRGDAGYHRRYEVGTVGEEASLSAQDAWADYSRAEVMTRPLSLAEAEVEFYVWA